MNIDATLSTREEQVGQLLAWGYLKKEIANHLHISQDTVVNHTRNIYKKADVTSVGQFSSWWFVVKHGVSLAAKPIIASLFIALIIINELSNNDLIMIRILRGNVKTVRYTRRRNEYDDDTIELL